MEPLLVHHKDIDLAKWDAAIGCASNGRIYALSSYLSYMCRDGWDAFILGDYEYIMPVPIKAIPGFRLAMQPIFTQQLGIFSRKPVTEAITKQFLTILGCNYKLARLHLNSGNPIPTGLPLTQKTNYELQLTSYSDIYNSYNPKFRRDLKVSAKNNLHYKEEENWQPILSEYSDLLKARGVGISSKSWESFYQLLNHFFERKMVFAAAIHHNNAIIAGLVLLRHQDRLYNLVSFSNAAGRRLMANYTLYDSIFRQFAGQGITFDFEGSDIHGVKKFYGQMGGINKPYPVIEYNHLPWPLKSLF